VQASCKVLRVERIDLWQLHRVDPDVPASEQFAAIAAMQQEGLIRHAGLSKVSIAVIEAAKQHFSVASVQNGYHLIERKNEPVLEYCEHCGLPFIGYFPLATGALAAPDSILIQVARELGLTPAQTAIAWYLRRSPHMVVIPGTQNPAHVRENIGAAGVTLTDEQFAKIARIGPKAAMMRAPK
jgi:pyridoxine 4-dehydrogenase